MLGTKERGRQVNVVDKLPTLQQQKGHSFVALHLVCNVEPLHGDILT
jgi:hypothetical protein